MDNESLVIKPKRPKGEDGYKVFSIRIKEDIVEKIDEIAGQTGHSRNEPQNDDQLHHHGARQPEEHFVKSSVLLVVTLLTLTFFEHSHPSFIFSQRQPSFACPGAAPILFYADTAWKIRRAALSR